MSRLKLTLQHRHGCGREKKTNLINTHRDEKNLEEPKIIILIIRNDCGPSLEPLDYWVWRAYIINVMRLRLCSAGRHFGSLYC